MEPPQTLEDMKQRFPCYQGSLENFDISKVGTHMSDREIRKIFKIGSAIWRKRHQAINLLRNEGQQDLRQENECPRCFLIKRGTIFISDKVLCTCAIKIPDGCTIYEEKETTTREPYSDNCEYTHVLPISVALGALWKTPNIERDQPTPSLLHSRTLLTRELDEEHEADHQCLEAPPVCFEDQTEITISDNFQLKSYNSSTSSQTQITPKPKNCVFYSPLGFGKTQFQKILMKKGIYVRDTDDIPFITYETLKGLLLTSSVLTNRLDLLTEDMPIVACLPSSELTINRSNLKLDDSDIRYWYECHKNLYKYSKIIILEMKETYLSEAFNIPGQMITLPSSHDVYDELIDWLKKINILQDNI